MLYSFESLLEYVNSLVYKYVGLAYISIKALSIQFR